MTEPLKNEEVDVEPAGDVPESSVDQREQPIEGTADGAFPRPAVPIAPILSFRGLAARRTPNQIDCLGGQQSVLVTSGRAALGLALAHAGIGEGDDVLVPAYHCESMVAPVRWRGARPSFYGVREDTGLDYADLAQRVTPHTRALLAVHYFGFPQDVRRIRQFCDQHGLVMIEDCAHALTGRSGGEPIGTTADYVIGSLMKFFPVFDGGFLASGRRSLDGIALRKPGFGVSAKALVNGVETAVEYGRLGLAGKAAGAMLDLKDVLWNRVKRLRNDSSWVNAPSSSAGGYGFDPDWVDVSMTPYSRAVYLHTRWQDLVTRRRTNYRRLHEALRDLDGFHGLFADLDPDVTPLVYPMYVDAPQEHFHRLKSQGVPIWRFGEFLDPAVTPQEFPVSTKLSRHIFQLPVHQELRDEELEWIIRTIRQSR